MEIYTQLKQYFFSLIWPQKYTETNWITIPEQLLDVTIALWDHRLDNVMEWMMENTMEGFPILLKPKVFCI